MEITITKNISRELIENVFVTALEGGSNYWYYLSNDTISFIRKKVSHSEAQTFSDAFTRAIFDYDMEIAIHDVEDEELIGHISKKTMQERLQKLYNSDDKWALEREINEDGDADSSDLVFQYLTMGECIYG